MAVGAVVLIGAVRSTILEGRQAAKKDFDGPPPQNMPAWRGTLDDRDVDAVIAYIIRLDSLPEPTKSDQQPDASFP